MTKLPKSNPLPQHCVFPTTPAATQRQPCVSPHASVVHPAPAVSLANHPLCIAPSLPLTAGFLFMGNTAAKLLHVDNSRTPSSAIKQCCLQLRIPSSTLFAVKISNSNSSRGNPSFLSSSPKATITGVSYTPALPATAFSFQ